MKSLQQTVFTLFCPIELFVMIYYHLFRVWKANLDFMTLNWWKNELLTSNAVFSVSSILWFYKRKTRYLKNGCINFLDFFTDTSYNELLLNRLKDKQLKHYSLSFAKKFKNYFFGKNAWSAKKLPKFEF